MSAHVNDCSEETEGISINERHEEMVQTGDFQGLLHSILTTPEFFIDLKESYRQLQRAIDIASRGGAANFAPQLFQSMTAFAANVMIRIQIVCQKEINASDARGRDRGMPPSEELLNHWLPLKQKLDTHLCDLLFTQASTLRQLALVQRHNTTVTDPPIDKTTRAAQRPYKHKKSPRIRGFHITSER